MSFLKNVSIFLIATIGLTSSAMAANQPWCHIRLRSASNTQIQFDYQVSGFMAGKGGYGKLAQAFESASGGDITSNSKVRIALNNWTLRDLVRDPSSTVPRFYTNQT